MLRSAFVRSVALRAPAPGEERDGHPWAVPAVAALADGLELDDAVTFLVGENGSGKSTVIEALAVALGMNPEGGSSNFAFATREEAHPLADALRVVRGARRPRTDFFLRAESFFNAATYVEGVGAGGSYGERGLHEQSHGESFLALALHRFGPQGLYLLDEPEAALSAQSCIALLRRIRELVAEGCQLVIATHSPILLAHPGAVIHELSEGGIERVAYDDAAPVRLTRAFLREPEAFLRRLADD